MSPLTQLSVSTTLGADINGGIYYELRFCFNCHVVVYVASRLIDVTFAHTISCKTIHSIRVHVFAHGLVFVGNTHVRAFLRPSLIMSNLKCVWYMVDHECVLIVRRSTHISNNFVCTYVRISK